MQKAKVSVCMIAYNHQAYIAQALDSILAQKTNFPFEIVIGDDNSTDDTGRICKEYAERFPGKIRYHLREKNLGMMPNFITTLGECEGTYIALCEGDDYWIDDSKLQTQADFLDNNPDHSLCCHNHYLLIKEKLVPVGLDFPEPGRIITTEEYLIDPFFHTTSYFFRNTAMPHPFPDWYKDVLAGDHFLVLFISMKGKMTCLNKRISVFRQHGKSVSYTRTRLDIKKNFVRHLELFNEYSNGRYEKQVRKVIHTWDLLYKVYEPIGYFKKLGYFLRNTGFYLKNFRYTGGIKLLIKFIVPYSVLRKVKG